MHCGETGDPITSRQPITPNKRGVAFDPDHLKRALNEVCDNLAALKLQCKSNTDSIMQMSKDITSLADDQRTLKSEIGSGVKSVTKYSDLIKQLRCDVTGVQKDLEVAQLGLSNVRDEKTRGVTGLRSDLSYLQHQITQLEEQQRTVNDKLL